MGAPLLSLGLVLAMQAVEAAPKADACAMPAGLREVLQRRFGSSRVLTAADLHEDERTLFKAEHRGACPGIARGRFFGARERPALAIVLLEAEPKKNIRLVVARPAMSTWTLLELDELDAGTTAVVSTEKSKPGTRTTPASAAEGANDVVILTGYESWWRVYVWDGRAFGKAQRDY